MGLAELIAAVVSIGCVTGVFLKALDVIALRKKGADDLQSLQSEIHALREENAELRRWAADLVLSFDSTLQQHGDRLQSLERRALSAGTAREAGVANGRNREQSVEAMAAAPVSESREEPARV